MEKKSKQRFSIYHLEDGEMYIKEFIATFQFALPNEEVNKIKGTMHLGSRSLTFEPENADQSIFKFSLRSLTSKPQLILREDTSLIKLTWSSLFEISDCSFRVPYRLVKSPTDVFVLLKEFSPETFFKQLLELIEKQESKYNSYESDSIDYLGPFYSFKFNANNIKSEAENILLKKEILVKMIKPLVEIPGMMQLTDNRLYFEPLYSFLDKNVYSIKYYKIKKCKKRRHLFKENSLEIETENKSYFFVLSDENIRNNIYQKIYDFTSPDCETNLAIEKFTEKWCTGEISNFEYIQRINDAAGRTKADLGQYPVFPWVIDNYSTVSINLADQANYRDLNKPIGALNAKRLASFKERYAMMQEPKFYYGTHYSTPAYVIGFLFRDFPELMLRLQNGKFDHASRLFTSIETDWEINLTNPGSVKELIPEFYDTSSSFLINKDNLVLSEQPRELIKVTC